MNISKPFLNSSSINKLSTLINGTNKFYTVKTSYFLNTSKNERLETLTQLHKNCFNTSRIEERIMENIGEGQGDPSFNPSPS
ncbi:hypothetical protein DLAC_02131 [Tieghemostelium lacteum]|uniref:Uncharacterized protein n=1 Tax=Tieghemostelium lacteum TaxID=361077 RepID=A0A152A457_TIELA|nr:hypothetical protein DLAC_02131 [Tieghemostelium lacteum]|eukprot:KYR01043.1 hypothetical protein DLAC_02131 [Tieghemostelium lacteum]